MNTQLHPPADAEPGYTPFAKAAHWLTFLLLIGSFSLGFYMVGLELSPTKIRLIAWHKWIGVLVFALLLFRLAWRLGNPPPPLPLTMPVWQQRVATLTHWLLYCLLFAAPLAGWLMSSAKGFQTVLFGVLPIPDLLTKNPPLGEQLEELHEVLVFCLLGLIGLHVAAALKHHFVDRDSVLKRMLPGTLGRDSRPKLP